MTDAGYFHVRESNDFHDSLIRQRRYALLQAAAILRAQVDVIYAASVNEDETQRCVDEAEALLAEIEKREKAEAQS